MNGDFHNIALSFGGNQSETQTCFEQALEILSQDLGPISDISSLYKSEAWGMKKGTHDFLNQVVLIQSDKTPKEVLSITQKIEQKLGRTEKSTNKDYQDRPIDIDILFINGKIIDTPRLTVPHFLIQKRKFILEPLAEIMPKFIHPVLKKSIKQLLLECKDKLEVIRL